MVTVAIRIYIAMYNSKSLPRLICIVSCLQNFVLLMYSYSITTAASSFATLILNPI